MNSRPQRYDGAPAVSMTARGPPPQQTIVQLGPGVKVRIGGHEFRINGLLGEGSFGAVWAATSPAFRGEVAIKEIICRSEVELGRASTEQRLLNFVGRAHRDPSSSPQGSPGHLAAQHFPSLVASEVQALGPDLWQVRLAMTKVVGRPLETWLENAQEGKWPVKVGSLAETCRCVRAMLDQLVPALEHLGTQAHHRDITTRNILVDSQGGRYIFGLVDFGLAVDAVKWKADLLTHDIGGDGHYWPTSSWFVLEYGAHHLESYPALLQEYEVALDLHALGIAALRSLMTLWVPEAEAAEAKANATWAQVAACQRLRIAWGRFWGDIARFWQPIFDAFACGGADALEMLKSRYAQAGVHHMISADLCAVRAALRQVRDCADLEDLRVVCSVLLLLIRPGKRRDDDPTWSRVRLVLQGSSPPRSPSTVRETVLRRGGYSIAAQTSPSRKEHAAAVTLPLHSRSPQAHCPTSIISTVVASTVLPVSRHEGPCGLARGWTSPTSLASMSQVVAGW